MSVSCIALRKDCNNCCVSLTLCYSSRPTSRRWSCQLGCTSALSVEASPPLLLARSLEGQRLWLAGRLVSPCPKRHSFNLKHLYIILAATFLPLGGAKLSHSEQNIYPLLYILSDQVQMWLSVHKRPYNIFQLGMSSEPTKDFENTTEGQ